MPVQLNRYIERPTTLISLPYVFSLAYVRRLHSLTAMSQPLDAITTRAKTDGSTVSSSLSDSDLGTAARTATGKDVAFVFITADSG